MDPEKKASLERNKNPSVIWILNNNDQNSSKWSLEEQLYYPTNPVVAPTANQAVHL